MDPNSWHHHHFPPPPPGGALPHATVCPVCSISHFPFCPLPFYPSDHQYHPPPPPPPSHPTDQFYPRPPPPPPHPYHQPLPPPPPPPSAAPYDPFVDHRGGPAINPHRQPADPWSSNSGLDRDLYAQVYPGYDHSHGGAKRTRFDDSGFNAGHPGSYKNENSPALSQVFSDDERRLKLIREHGGAMNTERTGLDPLEVGWKQSENFDSRGSNSNHSHNPQYSNFGRGNSLKVENHGMEKFELNYVKRNVDQGQFGYPQPQADISLKRKNVYENNGNAARQSQGLLESDQFHQNYGVQNQGGSLQNHYDSSGSNRQGFNVQPSVPQSPLPSLPADPTRPHFSKALISPSPSGSSVSLFPTPLASSSVATPLYPPRSESSSTFYPGKGHIHASTGFRSEGFRDIQQVQSTAYMAGNEFMSAQSQSPEKHRIFDASHIIKPPHRATRPDHIVIILRGLPGSGKSYLAKLLRDLEVENGGSVPRIHSMDDYFMTEVEKEEDTEVPKSSGSVRGKKQVTKSVLEYCYEPEMEEAYRSSMLKAFKKTLDEGVFSFVIVDDRNLRVADFAQFWATAKRSGYEVYLLEAPYKDPAGCAARNVHGFTHEEVQKMAYLWEDAPIMYFKLDIKSLLHGDTSMESRILEVDMDVEEGDPGCSPLGSVQGNNEKSALPREGNLAFDGPEDDQSFGSEADYSVEKVKELGKSKWSNDLDEDNFHKTEAFKAKSDALSGLKQSYLKEGKSVRFGDEVGNSGFSIAAAKTAKSFSLVIGPGSGYNSKSNPLPEEEKISASRYRGEAKKQNIFQEQLRAEHESFKAASDKRKQRLGGLNGADD